MVESRKLETSELGPKLWNFTYNLDLNLLKPKNLSTLVWTKTVVSTKNISLFLWEAYLFFWKIVKISELIVILFCIHKTKNGTRGSLILNFFKQLETGCYKQCWSYWFFHNYMLCYIFKNWVWVRLSIILIITIGYDKGRSSNTWLIAVITYKIFIGYKLKINKLTRLFLNVFFNHQNI